MRGTALVACLSVVLAGCGSSDEKSSETPPPRPRPAASPQPEAAPSPEAPAGGIVIKGSKRSDASSDAASGGDEQAARMRDARIAELTRKAGEGNVTSTWKDFLAPDGTFRILFPRVPDQKDQPVRLANGSVLPQRSYSVTESTPDERGFTVVVSDLPQALPANQVEPFFSGAAGALPSALKGHLLESKAITVDGNPGRETRFDYLNGKGVGRSRIVLAGTRCYSVSVFAPIADQDARDVERFLGSFKIIKAPNPAAAAPASGPAVAAASGEWVEFKAPDGSFRALFPQKPSTSDVDLSARADGVRPVGHRVMVLDSGGGPRIFAIAYADDVTALPDDDARRVFLEQSMQTPFGGGKGTLTGGRPMQIGSATGREATFRFDDGTVELDRCWFVGSRFYSVSTRSVKTDANTSDVQKFFDSFQLLKK